MPILLRVLMESFFNILVHPNFATSKFTVAVKEHRVPLTQRETAGCFRGGHINTTQTEMVPTPNCTDLFVVDELATHVGGRGQRTAMRGVTRERAQRRFILSADTTRTAGRKSAQKQKKQTERNKPQSITGMMGRRGIRMKSRKQQLVISMKLQKYSLNLASIALGVATEHSVVSSPRSLNLEGLGRASWRAIKHRFDGEPLVGAIEQGRRLFSSVLRGQDSYRVTGESQLEACSILIYPRMVIQNRMEGSITFGTGSEAGMIMGDGKKAAPISKPTGKQI
ncbi:hypothetical protein B0H14DRAFT_2591044 [Mycena olivaceomarginata]|nr:hypothetical protein B0H14DRAFT_2591044 [Mycena olivaceomarginata]